MTYGEMGTYPAIQTNYPNYQYYWYPYPNYQFWYYPYGYYYYPPFLYCPYCGKKLDAHICGE